MTGSAGLSTAALTADELNALATSMESCGTDVAGPLRADLINGGRSNLTYVLSDGERRWVLRTPPRAGRTPSAHDVAREFRVTNALAGTVVPVARPILLVEDESVLGVPYLIVDFVEGVSIRTRDGLASLDDVELSELLQALVSCLAELHRVDHRSVGLESFGRASGYAERQLRRWSSQWKIVGADRLTGQAEHVVSRLQRWRPDDRPAAIVHGDFRLDNTLIHRADDGWAPRVAAIVDWELSTIGDPVADVAMMCAYRDPAFDLILGEPSSWTSPRLPATQGLAELYVAAGGSPLDDWEFHLCLAYFKIAVIAAGVDHRRRAGAASGPGFETAGVAVERFLDLATQALERT
jgi:aminoglycoside phosphotransferase (APT) family kinase protein